MTDILILSTIVISFLSLILPLIALVSKKKAPKKILISVISITLCAFSNFLWIIYTYLLVKNNNLNTLEDTIGGVIFGSSIVFIGMIIINSIIFLSSKKKKCPH
ncbi:hypothetical protein [Vagococcus intermedius]|uniref:Uncharacterized protein n=1 Tax=Vagococcus intermedius TaxID=2991418 RepID=A0AAF0I8A4_9ENTE|nr:hypothetical protein [Vagococcus intermedius]WEG73964.1 hypothetical protein OL234_03370 [Vagococcus intermedius]WEG76044.1 hypothetical protein OL235_03375 [Vagococcus intermedius]